MKFFDREKEIKLLKDIELASHNTAQFTVLTGRRRIGKTSLVLKAYEEMHILYFFVSRKVEKDLRPVAHDVRKSKTNSVRISEMRKQTIKTYATHLKIIFSPSGLDSFTNSVSCLR